MVSLRVLALIFMLQSGGLFAQETVTWLTDFEAAKTQAKAESKVILLNFSGSDWCGNCIRLEKTLFESSEFTEYAKKNLVLLRADFPMKKKNKLSKEQTTHNESLAEKFNKKGEFPTVIILDADGNIIGRLAHPKETAAQYLENLSSIKK